MKEETGPRTLALMGIQLKERDVGVLPVKLYSQLAEINQDDYTPPGRSLTRILWRMPLMPQTPPIPSTVATFMSLEPIFSSFSCF